MPIQSISNMRPIASSPRSPDKPLDRMDRLADMGHFPTLVNAGATLNVVLTITATWWLQARLADRYPQLLAALGWTALVLVLNLTPVVLLRAFGFNKAPIPPLSQMDFFRDQHRFSDWVYLAASANMAFWILVSWSIFSIAHTAPALASVLIAAFLVTFSPVVLRPLTSR